MTKAISIAQIGLGYWGPNLIQQFVQFSDVARIIVSDIDLERTQKLQHQYGARVQIQNDQEALFDDPTIDAFVITLPAKDHFYYAKKALEADKHVLVEKPLAMTADEVHELIQLAEAKEKVLMVGHTFLYNSAVQKIKKYIQAGELGEIYYVFSQRLNLGRVRDDVNVVWNLAPHDLSILSYWFEEYPSEISAKGLSFLQPGIEDVAFVHLDFPSGKSAHIHLSWLDPSKTRKMVLVGSKKMLVYDDASADAKITIYDKGIDKKNIVRDLPDITSFGDFQLMQRVGDVNIPKLKFEEPLKVECRHFVDCILTNQKPLSDGKNGLEVVLMLQEIDQALQKPQTFNKELSHSV